MSQEDLWKDHAVWEHKTNALNYQVGDNRYHSRGKDNITYENNCDERRLHHDKNNVFRVQEHNNPYAEDFPTFATYSAFSIFGDQQATFHDFEDALIYYNNTHADSQAEEKYGPFNQFNYNQISQSVFDDIYWNSSWRRYHPEDNYSISRHPNHNVPFLKIVVYDIGKKFTQDFNQSFYKQDITINLFHLSKVRLITIRRSTQTGWLKYIIVVAITHNTARQSREFEVEAYFDPDTKGIRMGKAKYMGLTTTDKLILPPGYDSNIKVGTTDRGTFDFRIDNAGRPLHPLRGKESELIEWNKAKDMYQDYIKKSRSFKKPYKYDNSLPYWFVDRNRHFL